VAAQKLLDEGQEDKIRDRMDSVVRAFDPCISCSVHMAEVEKAPKENWKQKFEKVKGKEAPVFIGIGNPEQSDDGAGIKLALQLKDRGVHDVWVESELRETDISLNYKTDCPFIFLDAIDFKQEPGEITLLPLQYALNNASLSHKFLPFISTLKDYQMLKNSFILGIQPETIIKGRSLSEPVHKALADILVYITNSPQSGH
jgi:hydrogenase maturation protease